MKPRFDGLYVSPQTQIRQYYRRARATRLAALYCLLLVPLALLAGVGYYLLSDREQIAQRRLNAANSAKASLDVKAKALTDTRGKLAEIRRLEPVLKSRLPVSGVLSSLEGKVDADHVLTLVEVQARDYSRPTDVRVPGSFLLVVEGAQARRGERTDEKTDLAKWANTVLSTLPSGSTLSSTELRPSEDETAPTQFRVEFIVALGDWTRLGLRRVPIVVAP